MKLSLVVLSAGKALGQTIPITLSQFIIGRDPECNLRPASALISKRHCALLVKNDQAFIRDFDSTNGTFVNEEPVKGERQLQNQDMLRVGPLSFRVNLEAAPTKAPGRPTPKPEPAKATQTSDDESVAAMLLSLGEDAASEPGGAAAKDSVPGGSTVMDIPVPPLPGNTPPAESKTPEKKPEPAKPSSATSSAAAKALLEKYARRSRG